MNRRISLTAIATLGVTAIAGAGLAPAAIKKNEIRIVGGTKVKPGKFIKVDLRFKAMNTTVKSGATVTLRNKGEQGEPHTITFVEKRFLPEQFESGLEEQLFTAHGVDPENQEAPPANPVVDNGAPVAQGALMNVDTMFSKTVPGDSAFMFPDQKTIRFNVTADAGARLFYYCAIHPWMQGKISVN